MAFQACQSDIVFLPGADSPAGELIVSLDNLVSASCLGGHFGSLWPIGTFILPVPFLMTVGTLILS
jgi:hypothetical protein